MFREAGTAFHSLRFISVAAMKNEFLITATNQTYNLSIIITIALLLRATTKMKPSEYIRII